MTDRCSATLTVPIDPGQAADLLAGWGFLANPDLPDLAGDAWLLVALRDRPTLRHYDPEEVSVWVSRGPRCEQLVIDRATHDLERDFSWGPVVMADRLGVTNESISCGGRLTVRDLGELTVVILASPAPILRRGGHSQGWDVAAVDLAAFFGRVLLAVDYVPGFEARMTAAPPLARWAAFVGDAVGRMRASSPLRAERPVLWETLLTEADRLRHDLPLEWAEGIELARVTAGTGRSARIAGPSVLPAPGARP
jgi:hypothetical protein